MNVIQYFDYVRVINVPSRMDRRLETEAEFARHNFPINTDAVAFFPAFAPKTAEGFPNAGVRGCFMSHLQVLEEALAANSANALVLEDDIMFSKHIDELGRQAVEALDALDWDIAYFGHTLGSVDGKAAWLPVPASQLMLQSHFCAINGRALPRLTQFMRQLLSRAPGHPDGGPMFYDGALNTFRQKQPDIKVFFFSKNLGYQRPSKTDLHQNSFFDKSPLLKPFAVLGRRIKRFYLARVR